VQRVDDMVSVVSEESAAAFVVMGVTGVAEVGDGLVAAGGIFSRDHMRFVEGHRDGAAGAEPIPPVQPEIRLVRHGIEAATGRDRDMPLFRAGRTTHIAEFDVIARTTIAIHPAAEFLAARPRLHNAAAHLTVSDFTDT
jgi:hypothetical protein